MLSMSAPNLRNRPRYGRQSYLLYPAWLPCKQAGGRSFRMTHPGVQSRCRDELTGFDKVELYPSWSRPLPQSQVLRTGPAPPSGNRAELRSRLASPFGKPRPLKSWRKQLVPRGVTGANRAGVSIPFNTPQGSIVMPLSNKLAQAESYERKKLTGSGGGCGCGGVLLL